MPIALQAQSTNPLIVPITGVVTATGATFSGTFQVVNFVVQNGQLFASGLLTGTLSSAGTVLGTVTNLPVLLPVSGVSGTCQILTLTLGPLDLTLLGLMVHLNQIVLVITAQSGPGNLLGNLLCAVAHLLDSNGALTALAQLLNQIVHAL